MTLAISDLRYKHLSTAALLTAVFLAACGSENDENAQENTQVTTADVSACDGDDSAVPDESNCAEGKRAFDCPADVDLAAKCDFAGEWASGGTNEPTRSGNTWCCAF